MVLFNLFRVPAFFKFTEVKPISEKEKRDLEERMKKNAIPTNTKNVKEAIHSDFFQIFGDMRTSYNKLKQANE